MQRFTEDYAYFFWILNKKWEPGVLTQVYEPSSQEEKQEDQEFNVILGYIAISRPN